MPMAAAEIEDLIKAGIPNARVEITDLAGDGDHYAARVVAPMFKACRGCASTRRSMPRSAGAWAACSTRSSSPPKRRSRSK